ncbi:hypothetical protein [Poriferisphaera sp. WC338]|uniref:hypothetical protein n=1 Tax=Poriferisphaera sp. WC338 TaxID=3425129 RepID=UPI003D812BB3
MKRMTTLCILMILSLALGACSRGGYINIPEETGSIASNNPNNPAVSAVVVAAARGMIDQKQIQGPVEIVLLEGTEGEVAWGVQEKLGEYVFSRQAVKTILIEKPVDVIDTDAAAEIEPAEADHEDVVSGEDASEHAEGVEGAEDVYNETDHADDKDAKPVAPKQPEMIKQILTQADQPAADTEIVIKGVRVRGIGGEVDIDLYSRNTLDQFYTVYLQYEPFGGWQVKRLHSWGIIRDVTLEKIAEPVEEATE